MKLDRSLLRIPSWRLKPSSLLRERTPRLLRWLNLRPEEVERTLLMFGFYTATSIGVLWLEASSVALFLSQYGARTLPLIYMSGALVATVLGWLYSRVQRRLPLRQMLIGVAFCLALPLLLFRLGLAVSGWALFVVFAMRLWLEAVYVLSDLNNSIAANQLFNIRELKRTFPLISSGVLLADVLSGFSLPLVLSWVGIENVLLFACLMMALGALLLLRLCQRYRTSFPEARRRSDSPVAARVTSGTRLLRGQLQRYSRLLFAFFMLSQGLYLLVDFQFLNQLQQTLGQEERIAQFLGLFGGVLGLVELSTQWFLASRLIERLGVFIVMMVLPGSVLFILMAVVAGSGLVNLFWGLVALKFCDELFRYTLLAGAAPVLFQAIPERVQAEVQALVRGVADPLATLGAGLVIGGLVWLFNHLGWLTVPPLVQAQVFAGLVVVGAVAWLLVIFWLRDDYVRLLVLSAERGQLSSIEGDLRSMKRALIEALSRPGTEADKRSCIELLSQIDAAGLGEVLGPLLPELPPGLQQLSLEVMLAHPNPRSLSATRAQVQALSGGVDLLRPQGLSHPTSGAALHPEVLAAALRYLWLTAERPDAYPLTSYLRPDQNPAVRATAAALIVRTGAPVLVAQALDSLRQMLSHPEVSERLMGCRALGEAACFQALRDQVPQLFNDPASEVRCALLEAIAAARAQDHYAVLLQSLCDPTTQTAARLALVRLGNTTLKALVEFAEDLRVAEPVQLRAWTIVGEIGTPAAIAWLTQRLRAAWGQYAGLRLRYALLKILLRIPREAGIEGVLERLGRRGVEALIDQELLLLAQVYAARLDLDLENLAAKASGPNSTVSEAVHSADLLARALHDTLVDSQERLFLLLRLLYPAQAIQAASFNIQSELGGSLAGGLEILDNTLNLPHKRALLTVLDRCPDAEKRNSLGELAPYRRLRAAERLRQLIELRAFLSDWTLACCFHLARSQRWSLPTKSTLACLRHPTGYVREAVLSYLQMASPRTLLALLPRLYPDPNHIVNAQVRSLMTTLNPSANGQPPLATQPPKRQPRRRSGSEPLHAD